MKHHRGFAGRLQYPACLAERLGQQVPVLVNGLALVWANDGFICAVGEGLEPSLVYITEFGIGYVGSEGRVREYIVDTTGRQSDSAARSVEDFALAAAAVDCLKRSEESRVGNTWVRTGRS